MSQNDFSLKSDKIFYLRAPNFVKMPSSLCPHLFKEYTQKVGEILQTYKPQILALVQFTDVSEGLINFHVMKKSEKVKILKFQSNSEQMESLLEIIKKRMWGLENFITVLIDRNIDNWLAEELFQAYVRHLVVNMKKIQAQSICACFQGGSNSRIYQAWIKSLETFEKYLYEIGTSLGFLTMTMHPVKSALDFIANRLPLPKKQITTEEYDEEVLESDSEEEEEEPENFNFNELESEESVSKLPNPSFNLTANNLIEPATLNEKVNSSFDQKVIGDDVDDENGRSLEWDSDYDSNLFITPDDVVVEAFRRAESIVEVVERKVQLPQLLEEILNSGSSSVYDSCSSLADLEITRNINNQTNTEHVVSEMETMVQNFDCTSISTSATPTKLSDSFLNSATLTSSSSTKRLEGAKKVGRPNSGASLSRKVGSLKSNNLNPKPKLEFPTLKSNAALAKHSINSSVVGNPASASPKAKSFNRNPTAKAQFSDYKTSEPVKSTVKKIQTKPATMTSSKTTVTTPVSKDSKHNVAVASSISNSKISNVAVASVSPRQRVLEDIRAKKANAPSPPPLPSNVERLRPQDYNIQQWSNKKISKGLETDNKDRSSSSFI